MPAVSVIVPNYNHAQFLRQRIESILAQTYQDFELILLDDASADGSREILRECACDPRLADHEDALQNHDLGSQGPENVRLELNETNSGSPFKQWNKGVRLARGKYIWIAESDDYAEPRFLERLVGVLESNSETVFAYCRSWRVLQDERVEGFGDYNLPDPQRWTADFCVDGRELCEKYFALITPIPNASSAVFRKDAYKRVGGADESLRLCGDWKLWAALSLEGKVAYVSDPMNYFRYHSNSARNQTERAGVDAREYLHVTSWVLDRVKVSEDEFKRICEARANGWVPVLLSFRTPLALKRSTLRAVRALDPHPLRRVARPAWAAIQRKIRRHWRELRARVSPARTAV